MAAILNAVPWPDKIRDRRLREAVRRVDRTQFLDVSLRPRAADDCPLPIGHAQTTSQPMVIIQMLEMMLAATDKTPDTVLEIGAGCGYQTAILASLCRKVVAIERIGELAKQASARLRAMGYNNAHVIHGDGLDGHAAAAPFDGVIVCAEYAVAPTALVAQLAPAGRLVMPLLSADGCRLIAFDSEGRVAARRGAVSFVPMLEGTS